MSLKTTTIVSIRNLLQEALDLSVPEDRAEWTLSEQMTSGTGAAQADRVWRDRRTLVGGNSETLDMYALTAPLGGTTGFEKIKLLAVYLRDDTPGARLRVGGDASSESFASWISALGGHVPVGPRGLLLLYSPDDGYAMGPTASLLKITNQSAFSVDYDIIAVGTSA